MPSPDIVRVIDKGLFVIANSYSTNMTIPVVDGVIMSVLSAGHFGNHWEAQVLDSQPHNFQFEVDTDGSVILENATIIHSATVYMDLGATELPRGHSANLRWI